MDTSPRFSSAAPPTSGRPSGRRAAWATLLLGLALSQVLGGGCTVFYSSNNHDDDHDDDDEDVVIAGPPLATDEGLATGDFGSGGLIDGSTSGSGSAGHADGGAGVGSIVIVLQEVPDADGDGLSDLAILAVDGGSAELPASTWLLSGSDGAVLDARDLGALRPRVHVLPRSAGTTAPQAALPSAPTTSAH